MKGICDDDPFVAKRYLRRMPRQFNPGSSDESMRDMDLLVRRRGWRQREIRGKKD